MSRIDVAVETGEVIHNAVLFVEVALNSDAVEYLSTGEQFTIHVPDPDDYQTETSRVFTEDGVDVVSVESSVRATVELPITTPRMANFLANNWRGESCRVWAFVPYSGYTLSTRTYGAGNSATVLLVDGLIDSITLSRNYLRIEAIQSTFLSAVSPPFMFNQLTSTMPAKGEKLEWNQDASTPKATVGAVSYTSPVVYTPPPPKPSIMAIITAQRIAELQGTVLENELFPNNDYGEE